MGVRNTPSEILVVGKLLQELCDLIYVEERTIRVRDRLHGMRRREEKTLRYFEEQKHINKVTKETT